MNRRELAKSCIRPYFPSLSAVFTNRNLFVLKRLALIFGLESGLGNG
ncbi:hypothetical protein LCGC14_3138920, partial [marine sediment metagenome]